MKEKGPQIADEPDANRLRKLVNRVLSAILPKSAVWDRQYAAGTWDYLDKNPDELKRSEAIAKMAQGDTLDVGCGAGTVYGFLQPEQQQNYRGIDLSQQAIQRARQKYPQFQGEAADFLTYAPAKTFDSLIFNEVLYYMPKEEALAQVDKLLKSNGRLIISMSELEGFASKDALWARLDESFAREPESEKVFEGVAPGGKKVIWKVRTYLKRAE